MTVPQRFELVRLKGLRFHCLCKGHGIQTCKFRPDELCGRDGCRAKHHRLVHKPREGTHCTIEEYLSVYQDDVPLSPQEVQIAYNCGVSSSTDRNFRSEELTPEQVLLKQ